MKNWKLLLKILVTTFFVGWLITTVEWTSFWEQIVNVKKVGIFLYAIIFLVGTWISSCKWSMIAKKSDIDLPLRKAFEFYLTGAFVNNFMPSFIGGDAYRAYQAGKNGLKYKKSIAVVLADRFFGILGAGIITSVAFLFNFREVIEHYSLIIFHAVILFGTLLLIFLIFGMDIMKVSERWKDSKVAGYLLGKLATLSEFVDDRQYVIRILGWSVLFNLVGISALNYILFWSLGIDVGILNYMSVILLISIVSSIPVSINNIGVKEWAYITFFGFFSVGAAPLAAAAILSRFLQMLISFFAIPLYLKNR